VVILLACIIATTLVAFYIAVLVGLHKPEPEGQVRAWNYPETLVYRDGESWAVRDEED
jgi:hypothetical protein